MTTFAVMYEHLGLQDIFFIMLYGGAAMLAVVGCCYLLLTPGNAFSSDIRPPKVLRGWAATFMAFVALSHVWWGVLGNFWLQEDHLLRNAVAIMLDSVTLMPCMMAVLLRMLQDRQRPLWPIGVAMILWLRLSPCVFSSGVVPSNAFCRSISLPWLSSSSSITYALCDSTVDGSLTTLPT